jgi:hypothetical protein
MGATCGQCKTNTIPPYNTGLIQLYIEIITTSDTDQVDK